MSLAVVRDHLPPTIRASVKGHMRTPKKVSQLADTYKWALVVPVSDRSPHASWASEESLVTVGFGGSRLLLLAQCQRRYIWIMPMP